VPDLSGLPGCAGSCHDNAVPPFRIDMNSGRKMPLNVANPSQGNVATICSVPRNVCGGPFCQMTQSCCTNGQCTTQNVGNPTPNPNP
jgi:hypothetical protein